MTISGIKAPAEAGLNVGGNVFGGGHDHEKCSAVKTWAAKPSPGFRDDDGRCVGCRHSDDALNGLGSFLSLCRVLHFLIHDPPRTPKPSGFTSGPIRAIISSAAAIRVPATYRTWPPGSSPRMRASLVGCGAASCGVPKVVW